MKYFKLILIGILLLPSLGYGSGDFDPRTMDFSKRNTGSNYVAVNWIQQEIDNDLELIDIKGQIKSNCLKEDNTPLDTYDWYTCNDLRNRYLSREAEIKRQYSRNTPSSSSSAQGGTAGASSSTAAYDPCAGTTGKEKVACVELLANRDQTIARHEGTTKMVLGGLASGTGITLAAISAKAERVAGEQYYDYFKGLNVEQRRARQYITAPQFFSTSALNPEFPLFAMGQNQSLGAIYLMGKYGFFNQNTTSFSGQGGMQQGYYNPLNNPFMSMQSTMNWFNSPYGMGSNMYGAQNPWAFAGNTSGRLTGGTQVTGR